MSEVQTFASYHLLSSPEGEIIERYGREFDQTAYSRMKYGDRAATKRFANGIADMLVEESSEVVEGPTPPDFLVAYKAVPPACYYLSRYCLDRLNLARLEKGNEPGRILQVYKDKVAATNYAVATDLERKAELNGIGFTLERRDLQQSSVIVLDDIRITGGAERRILDVITPARPRLITLGYIALFDSQQAKANPSVEGDLNSTHVNSIEDLMPTIDAGNFDLNIRTLKMILSTPKHRLYPFLTAIPVSLLEEIVRGAVDTGVDFISQYQIGFTATKIISEQRDE